MHFNSNNYPWLSHLVCVPIFLNAVPKIFLAFYFRFFFLLTLATKEKELFPILIYLSIASSQKCTAWRATREKGEKSCLMWDGFFQLIQDRKQRRPMWGTLEQCWIRNVSVLLDYVSLKITVSFTPPFSFLFFISSQELQQEERILSCTSDSVTIHPALENWKKDSKRNSIYFPDSSFSFFFSTLPLSTFSILLEPLCSTLVPVPKQRYCKKGCVWELHKKATNFVSHFPFF